MVASRIMHDPISLVFVRCEIGVERRGSDPVHDVRISERIVANGYDPPNPWKIIRIDISINDYSFFHGIGSDVAIRSQGI
jgi:hypothetical protein